MLAVTMVIGTQSVTAVAEGNVVEAEVDTMEKNVETEDGIEEEIKEENVQQENVEEKVEVENVGQENDETNAENMEEENPETNVEEQSEMIEALAEGNEVASGVCGDNLTWVLTDDGTLTISGTGEMWDYGHNDVSSFTTSYMDQIKKIVIQEGVTSIGCDAFIHCWQLSEVDMPIGLKSIGEDAFYYCNNLQNIRIPDEVNSIGAGAFAYCGLEKIRIPNGVSSIEGGIFYNSGLREIIIPDGVTNIGENAFFDCDNLEKIIIPDSVTSIGENVFFDCASLEEIRIPKGVTTIGAGAFGGCMALKTIRFEGDAPEFGKEDWEGLGEMEAFYCVTATVYYPENNPTWTVDKMQNYGGNLTWNPWNLFIVEEATDSVYVKGSSNGATIKCTEELGKFVSVAVDGVIVDSSNYTVVEGSTVLTFLSSYLDTLSVGDHVVTLNYTYGSVDTSLTVLENGTNLNTPANGTNTSGNVGNANGGSNTGKNGSTQGGAPKTGDNTSMMLWLFVVLATRSGCFILFQKRRATRI